MIIHRKNLYEVNKSCRKKDIQFSAYRNSILEQIGLMKIYISTGYSSWTVQVGLNEVQFNMMFLLLIPITMSINYSVARVSVCSVCVCVQYILEEFLCFIRSSFVYYYICHGYFFLRRKFSFSIKFPISVNV